MPLALNAGVGNEIGRGPCAMGVEDVLLVFL
jgi:hypothetical protein